MRDHSQKRKYSKVKVTYINGEFVKFKGPRGSSLKDYLLISETKKYCLNMCISLDALKNRLYSLLMYTSLTGDYVVVEYFSFAIFAWINSQYISPFIFYLIFFNTCIYPLSNSMHIIMVVFFPCKL